MPHQIFQTLDHSERQHCGLRRKKWSGDFPFLAQPESHWAAVRCLRQKTDQVLWGLSVAGSHIGLWGVRLRGQ